MWDIVTISLAANINKNDLKIQKYLKYLKNLKFLPEEVLVCNDACEDVGSGGSALNALLITAERLCALRGYTVLSDDVLVDSRILIVLVGSIEAITKSEGKIQEVQNGYIQPTYFSKAIENAGKIAENTQGKGVWIIGTDAFFELKLENFQPEYQHFQAENQISAFCFTPETRLELGDFGSYDSKNGPISDIFYPSTNPENIILAIFHLPPTIAAKFLGFINIFPISATTYYGQDSGTLGLKLSIFFDFLQATWSTEQDFVYKNEQGVGKIEGEKLELRNQARKLIFGEFSKFEAISRSLEVENYQFSDFSGQIQDLHYLHNMLLASLEDYFIEGPSKAPENNLEKLIKSAVILKKMLKLPTIRDYFETITNLRVTPQTLFSLSLGLSLESEGLGGLRSGPAANRTLFGLLESPERLFEEIQRNWRGSESGMVRAARHLEAAAQILIAKMVENMCEGKTLTLPEPNPKSSSKFNEVTVFAPARCDLFGGWLDTPPIFFDFEEAGVFNMAILVDGKRPISCRLQKSTTNPAKILLHHEKSPIFLDENLSDSNKPTHPTCLLSACIKSLGFSKCSDFCAKFGAGFGLEFWLCSELPHGSGLGTSSILGATILRAIWELYQAENLEFQREIQAKIAHSVLKIEQIMTTGGGWQDQIGAIYPGIKLGIAQRNSSQNFGLKVERIEISKKFQTEINCRLVLIYTGKTRLAKNILQEVIRNWYKDGEVKEVLMEMYKNIDDFLEILLDGKMPIDLINQYYAAKKLLTSGCEPKIVKNLLAKLKNENLIETGWLAGAGGGGFCYVWLAKSVKFEDVCRFLERNGEFCDMTCHTVTISNQDFDVIFGK
ncbi:unnamed protein product [Caenorhabditis angaria]|uniref:GHMP kinase N-terminal domain-containing protein n=1 Tax=Caenorhabditis angaria TaxID=860376 RepID=A0A9P1IA67_9PELO|nr:unnamed protein product [Caenorhabditis angaria]